MKIRLVFERVYTDDRAIIAERNHKTVDVDIPVEFHFDELDFMGDPYHDNKEWHVIASEWEPKSDIHETAK